MDSVLRQGGATCGRRMRKSNQTKFAKQIAGIIALTNSILIRRFLAVGSWSNFLREDAATTRKAFAIWASENYLQPAQGRMLSKNTRSELGALANSGTISTISRDSLSPETVTIIQNWENIPLVPNSPDWRTAGTRLIRDLVIDGTHQVADPRTSSRSSGDSPSAHVDFGEAGWIPSKIRIPHPAMALQVFCRS